LKHNYLDKLTFFGQMKLNKLSSKNNSIYRRFKIEWAIETQGCAAVNGGSL